MSAVDAKRGRAAALRPSALVPLGAFARLAVVFLTRLEVWRRPVRASPRR